MRLLGLFCPLLLCQPSCPPPTKLPSPLTPFARSHSPFPTKYLKTTLARFFLCTDFLRFFGFCFSECLFRFCSLFWRHIFFWRYLNCSCDDMDFRKRAGYEQCHKNFFFCECFFKIGTQNLDFNKKGLVHGYENGTGEN